MIDWVNEEAIEKIQRKLCNKQPLEPHEIEWCIAALRKANDCKQAPYYEVVYHDEYDKKERRIMQPLHRSVKAFPENEDYMVVRDRFELNFDRVVRG